MDIFNEAIIFATEVHAGDKRKGTNVPYIVHPLEAAAIVATMTDDKEILAAAVLHDVVEDTDYTAEDVKQKFGERIARLVASDSENKRRELPSEETWKIRKEETLDYLENKATKEEKMIVLGDKLSNIRAIYRDYFVLGDDLWDRFNQKNKSEHAWYYCGIAKRLGELSDTAAYKEYTELLEKVFND